MGLKRFRYVPALGARVKFALWETYVGFRIHPWAWLRVELVNEETDSVRLAILNGAEPTGEIITAALDSIQKPIGWSERYTIVCKPDEVQKVLGWLARGIAVRLSHNLSGSMPMAFQPLDNSDSPHWQYPELTDTVLPADVDARIRIVQWEENDILVTPTGLYFSSLTKPERKRERARLESEGWKVAYNRVGNFGWYATRETVIKDWKEAE